MTTRQGIWTLVVRTLLDAGVRLTAITGTDSHGPVDDDDASLGFTHVYATDPSEAAILEGIRRGRVCLSRGPTLSFGARGSDGAEVHLPGESMTADGPIDLDVEVHGLERPATLWYVTSGSSPYRPISIFVASSTTWLFVRMNPSLLMMNPLPAACVVCSR